LFKNNKHTIAKVQKNSNRHGVKSHNTKVTALVTLLSSCDITDLVGKCLFAPLLGDFWGL